MGAEFRDMSLPGSLPRKEVTGAFEAEQQHDRYENGHCYSGGFGMASGLLFASKEFDDVSQAENWLTENCQKWEEAICVRVRDGDMWLIGAWCAC